MDVRRTDAGRFPAGVTQAGEGRQWERNGDVWPVHVGLARVYIASGDTTKALEHARIAIKQAPDDLNRNNLKAMIAALESGKPVTQ
jgi:Tfp pilus assembly protein PilF